MIKNLLTSVILCIVLFMQGCSEKKSDNISQEKDKDNTMKDTIKKNDNITKDTMNTTDTTQGSKTQDESNVVILKTSMGDIEIELFEKDAPQHAANFKKLVRSGFYDGTTFHRVIEGFMIQGGDPNSKDNDKSNDGIGGPGYTVPAEIKAKHEKGSVAAARLGDAQNPKRESSGSQFYIVTGNASHLDGQYTVFGKVIKGLDIAMKIEKVKTDERDNPIEKVVIKKAELKK
jgi:cyclophilin family peptidyl-prolyl cis-trans isomerase